MEGYSKWYGESRQADDLNAAALRSAQMLVMHSGDSAMFVQTLKESI